jgi:hypothetical protein
MEVIVNEGMDWIKYRHGNRHNIFTSPVDFKKYIYYQGLVCLSENIGTTLFLDVAFQDT